MIGRIIIYVFFLSYYCVLYSQSTAGEKYLYESRYIVDMPSAGILDKSKYAVYSSAFGNGGVLLQCEAAPFSYFNIGLSYSGINIIGSNDIKWQNLPGIHLKFRILNESLTIPAIALGLNSQGKGNYYWDEKRFETMSPGIFISASKNYKWWLGTVAIHSGINYSFEPLPKDRLPNLYLRFEQSLGSYLSLNSEYNCNIDETTISFMKNKGLLNTALRWSLSKGVTIELQARDLLEHIRNNNAINRVFYLEYIGSF